MHSSYFHDFPLRFARAGLPLFATPLQRLPRLSDYLGSDVRVKRDDYGDFALAGSKARKLDFILANTITKGYSTVVGSGPPNSNSCRALAAACAHLGLACHLFLWGDMPDRLRGNAALASALGATIHWLGSESWVENEKLAQDWAATNGAYSLPIGGTEPLGVTAMISAYFELAQQCDEQNFQPATIVHASATGGISAGLRIGAAAWEKATFRKAPEIQSIAALDNLYEGKMAEKYNEIVREAQDFTGINVCQPLNLNFSFVGEGYEIVPARAKAASDLLARQEAVLLDGYYVGRAAAATIELARTNSGPIVLWHTGGTQGLMNESMLDDLWGS